MAQGVRGRLIGNTGHLGFEVTWPDDVPAGLEGLGWSDVVLWVGGRRLWTSEEEGDGDGQGGPVRWTWVDLVEHLAHAWPFLLYEENAPFGLVASGPEHLRDPALLRSVPDRSPVEVEDAVHAFQQRHDLAAGLQGIWVTPVWLVREGRTMWVRADGRDLWLPLDDVRRILESFVDEVLGHEPVGESPRGAYVLRAWRNRAPGRKRLLRLRTGLPWRVIQDWTPGERDPEEWWGDPRSEDESPLMAAARLSAPLSLRTRDKIVHAIDILDSSRTDKLDGFSSDAEAFLAALPDMKPYEQGYALALWLRKRLEAGDNPVNPERILTDWGVQVQVFPQDLDDALDAVACWGGGKGPAILTNGSGKHAASKGGRRATLAHEIAHLLVDRNRHLPLVEVFGGSTPLHLEQRARAFAAEFLLPREVAAREVARHASFEAAVRTMRTRYGVSAEVMGWQITNGPGWHLLDPKEQNRVRRWCRPWSSMVGGRASDGSP